MKATYNRWKGESGSAFVISILVLFILMALSMSLMLTTTTETDISTYYRWGQMAFFNADAALEYAKNVATAYAVIDGDFRNLLPPARGPGSMDQPPADGLACTDPSVAGCRDYQYSTDQGAAKVFIGRVVRDLGGRPLQYDFRSAAANDTRGDIDGDGVNDVQGTVTIWARRPVIGTEDYGFSDNRHDRVILTAEGTAPNYEAIGTGRAVSVRRLELTITLPPSGITGSRYSDSTKSSDPGSKAAQADRLGATVW